MTTVTVSNIPDLTAAVSVPRLVAIEHPFGQTMGNPGDQEVQRAVLWEALEAMETMKAPGSIKHLPFECSEIINESKPHQLPPILSYLVRHPWQLSRLLSRSVPRESQERP